MVYITQVNMAVGGSGHEHIANVRYVQTGSNDTKHCSRQQMVEFLRANPGQARVRDGIGEVTVGVVEATPPYIRTYKDGRPTDNLLNLPRY